MKFIKGWTPFQATNNESFETFFGSHLGLIIIIYQYDNQGYTRIPKAGGSFNKHYNYWKRIWIFVFVSRAFHKCIKVNFYRHSLYEYRIWQYLSLSDQIDPKVGENIHGFFL